MRLLVCGSRTWTERERTQREIAALVPDVLIHGDAGQWDKRIKGQPVSSDVLFAWLARNWSFNSGHPLHVLPFPADWSLGKKAGPLRNARMLAEGKPDRGLAFGALWRLVPAFPCPVWRRTGTGDMVAKMLRAGLPVRWVESPGVLAQDLTKFPEHPA